MTERLGRFERQASLVPAEQLSKQDIWVVGCGAVGRNVALHLASMGATKITLVDFDEVEPTNITTQGWRQDQLYMSKVEALRDDVLAIDSSIKVVIHNRRWNIVDGLGTAGFICVDSISTREFIWKACGKEFDRPEFLVDMRTLGELGKVLTAPATAQFDAHYDASFFAESETEPGMCTARLTIYSATIAAGMACHQFARWLRGGETDHEVRWSLLASEMDVPRLIGPAPTSKVTPAKPRKAVAPMTPKAKRRKNAKKVAKKT